MKTNFEYVLSWLTADDLADMISNNMMFSRCKMCTEYKKPTCRGFCSEHIADWLKQEYKEGSDGWKKKK